MQKYVIELLENELKKLMDTPHKNQDGLVTTFKEAIKLLTEAPYKYELTKSRVVELNMFISRILRDRVEQFEMQMVENVHALYHEYDEGEK